MIVNITGAGLYFVTHSYKPADPKHPVPTVPKVEKTGTENKSKTSTEKKGTIIDEKV